jgi:hypothetical protein
MLSINNSIEDIIGPLKFLKIDFNMQLTHFNRIFRIICNLDNQ